jgi:4-hydroxybenzoate polyprenyltransferase
LLSTSSETLGRALATDPREPLVPNHRTATSVVLAALESLRPHQWLKNLLVFVPLAAAHRIAELGLLLPAMRAFAAFSLCASAVYLANDLHDIAADRSHPHKRFRAIASGRLPRRLAVALAPILIVAAAFVAWPLGPRFCAVLGLYLSLMVGYTWHLKTGVSAWLAV